ncbi:MAG: hypothetical protein ABI298_08670 [Acidimicrobiales bacterium]
MEVSVLAIGSLAPLADVVRRLGLLSDADVVVVPTAAAFTGITEAALEVAMVLNDLDVRVEALMVRDRTSAAEDYFTQRLKESDLVELCDGSPLHARSVWRDTAFGEAIGAAKRIVAVGAVASVLGEVMIDPRGGAPTTGLGHRSGIAIAVPASDDQMRRTRSLLASDVALVTLGPLGVVRHDGIRWRVESADVVVTRGLDVVEL